VEVGIWRLERYSKDIEKQIIKTFLLRKKNNILQDFLDVSKERLKNVVPANLQVHHCPSDSCTEIE